MFEKIALIWSKYGYIYLQGTWGTIYLALLTVLLGTVLGTLLAIMKFSKVKPLEWIVGVYVWIIRGTPILLQIYFFYFFVPDILPFEINEEQCIIMALVVNASAYVAEIIRGGLMAVDGGQMEAGRSLGLNYFDTMRFIVIPQAIKAILPALGNEFIILLKDTSLITVIGGKELLHAAQGIMGRTYEAMFPLIGIACMYLVLVMIFTWLLGKLERRLRQSDRR